MLEESETGTLHQQARVKNEPATSKVSTNEITSATQNHWSAGDFGETEAYLPSENEEIEELLPTQSTAAELMTSVNITDYHQAAERVVEVWQNSEIIVNLEPLDASTEEWGEETREIYMLIAEEIGAQTQEITIELALGLEQFIDERPTFVLSPDIAKPLSAFAELIESCIDSEEEIRSEFFTEGISEEQQLEVSLAQMAALFLRGYDNDPQLQTLIHATNELTEVLFTIDQDSSEVSSVNITPEAIEKLQALLQNIGYHHPAEALKGFLSRNDIHYLLQVIYYLSQLTSRENQQEFGLRRHLDPTPLPKYHLQSGSIGKLVLAITFYVLDNSHTTPSGA